MAATYTYNQVVNLLRSIKTAHKQLRSFGIGEEHEINGATEADRQYPKLWVIPVDSVVREWTIERTFELLCFDLVHKDETNENDVHSDCEQILHDFFKIIKNESDNYNIIGDPQIFPFTERYMDDVSGWRGLITIETEFASNYCDIPKNQI